MPTLKQEDIENIAPQKLVGSFGKSRLLFCLVVAIGLHVLVIGGSSMQYLYELVNPEARTARLEAETKQIEAEKLAELAKKQAEMGVTGTNATAQVASATDAAGATNATEAAASTNTIDTAAASDDERALLEKYKDAPVVKRITEKAKPEEIPDQPDDVGIEIKDTNPF